MLRDLYTFLEKAVPDTKLTLKKYSDAKFEFLVRRVIQLCSRQSADGSGKFVFCSHMFGMLFPYIAHRLIVSK